MTKLLKKITAAFVLSLMLISTIAVPLSAQNSFTEREVIFTNGSVELSGTVILPSQKEKAPVVIFLHGSGPHQREGFRQYAEEFAAIGVASLFYDKRGTGSSGGSWINSSLIDLADDALAAVEYLKKLDYIDSTRIGFWGISQAGWIAPIAASQSQDIAFMILVSGGGASPKESEMFSYDKEFEKAGLSNEQKAEAFEVLDVYFGYLETCENRPALISRLQELKETWLKPLAEQLSRIVPSESNCPNWSWVAGYDPANDIAQLRMPVLLMFGDADTEQPTEVAVDRWREGLTKAGNENFTVVVFPGAGHGIRMGTEHSRTAPFADGYEETMLNWLKQNVLNKSK